MFTINGPRADIEYPLERIYLVHVPYGKYPSNLTTIPAHPSEPRKPLPSFPKKRGHPAQQNDETYDALSTNEILFAHEIGRDKGSAIKCLAHG